MTPKTWNHKHYHVLVGNDTADLPSRNSVYWTKRDALAGLSWEANNGWEYAEVSTACYRENCLDELLVD